MKIWEIVEATEGKLLNGDLEAEVAGLTQDTRVIKEGYLYIPLVGNRDGHDFIGNAFEAGATSIITSKVIEDKEHNVVLVKDTHKAMGDIARYIREKSGAFVVGVTGSVGKTSTKDMIASVVSKGFSALKTQGNFNNDIGVPLTIYNYKNEEAMVIEMGMNHLGEIDYLTKIAKPNIAVITNVGTAHIGEVGSRENILKAKMEITHGLVEGGILIVNNDNDLLSTVKDTKDYEVLSFGIDGNPVLKAENVVLNETGSTFTVTIDGKVEKFEVNVPGKHFVSNALAALAVGLVMDIDLDKIKEGISTFELTKKRADVLELDHNIKVYDGTYNANLDSMIASIDVLANHKERKIAVLADMLELGDFEEELHREVGKHCVNKNIDTVLTVGNAAKFINEECVKGNLDTRHFEDNNSLVEYLKGYLKENDVVLVKGSNGMHLSEVIDALKEK